MTVIIDYGVGNLFSLAQSFAAIGEETLVSGDPADLRRADRLVLPGVGAFRDAAASLKSSGLQETVIELANSGKPLLGVCLGMQLLFDESREYGTWPGLGLIPGAVVPIADVIPKELKIPQIGWNSLTFTGKASPIFKYINEGDFVYFVHSYYAANCEENVIATTEYGAPLTAAVAKGNIYGCQFHPEKSGTVGLNILRAFCQLI